MQWLLGTTVGTVLSFKKFRPFWYVRNDIEGHFILQKSISIKEQKSVIFPFNQHNSGENWFLNYFFIYSFVVMEIWTERYNRGEYIKSLLVSSTHSQLVGYSPKNSLWNVCCSSSIELLERCKDDLELLHKRILQRANNLKQN